MNFDLDALRAEYAPYHLMPEFQSGFDDYARDYPPAEYDSGVAQQAYDRGYECAMKVFRSFR
jgi:hypothetical protein